MKDTALVVFKKDTDLYTLNQQLSHYRESADIYDVDEYETYPNLQKILESLKGRYANLVYLTEDEDWLSFGRDLSNEYGKSFGNITTRKKLAEHLFEAVPAAAPPAPAQAAKPAANTTQQQQKQPPKTEQPKAGVQALVVNPCSTPFKNAKAEVGEMARLVQNNGVLVLPSIDHQGLGQFLAQSTQLALIQGYLGKDTPLKDVKAVINLDLGGIQADKGAGFKASVQQVGNIANFDTNFTGFIHISPSAASHKQACSILGKQMADLKQFTVQPSENANFYKEALEIYKFVQEQLPLRQKKNEEMEKQQKDAEKQTKSTEHTQKEIEKKYGQKESTVNEFLRLREAEPGADPSHEKEKDDKNKPVPELRDTMIWNIVEAAHRYSQGQEIESETPDQTRKLSSEKLKRFLEIIGITHDIAAAEELAKRAGYALVLDTAKAIKSLADKTDKNKKQPAKKLATDNVSIMLEYPNYVAKIRSQFDDLGALSG